MHNMCLVRPALLYLNVHVLKVFYEQINYYYYYYIVSTFNKKLIRRWDSERELCLRRHRARTTKYNRLMHKFQNRSTRLCVGMHVYKIQWNNAI